MATGTDPQSNHDQDPNTSEDKSGISPSVNQNASEYPNLVFLEAGLANNSLLNDKVEYEIDGRPVETTLLYKFHDKLKRLIMVFDEVAKTEQTYANIHKKIGFPGVLSDANGPNAELIKNTDDEEKKILVDFENNSRRIAELSNEFVKDMSENLARKSDPETSLESLSDAMNNLVGKHLLAGNSKSDENNLLKTMNKGVVFSQSLMTVAIKNPKYMIFPGQDLNNLSILTVQRTPRYRLLWEEMENKTKELSQILVKCIDNQKGRTLTDDENKESIQLKSVLSRINHIKENFEAKINEIKDIIDPINEKFRARIVFNTDHHEKLVEMSSTPAPQNNLILTANHYLNKKNPTHINEMTKGINAWYSYQEALSHLSMSTRDELDRIKKTDYTKIIDNLKYFTDLHEGLVENIHKKYDKKYDNEDKKIFQIQNINFTPLIHLLQLKQDSRQQDSIHISSKLDQINLDDTADKKLLLKLVKLDSLIYQTSITNEAIDALSAHGVSLNIKKTEPDISLRANGIDAKDLEHIIDTYSEIDFSNAKTEEEQKFADLIENLILSSRMHLKQYKKDPNFTLTEEYRKSTNKRLQNLKDLQKEQAQLKKTVLDETFKITSLQAFVLSANKELSRQFEREKDLEKKQEILARAIRLHIAALKDEALFEEEEEELLAHNYSNLTETKQPSSSEEVPEHEEPLEFHANELAKPAVGPVISRDTKPTRLPPTIDRKDKVVTSALLVLEQSLSRALGLEEKTLLREVLMPTDVLAAMNRALSLTEKLAVFQQAFEAYRVKHALDENTHSGENLSRLAHISTAITDYLAKPLSPTASATDELLDNVPDVPTSSENVDPLTQDEPNAGTGVQPIRDQSKTAEVPVGSETAPVDKLAEDAASLNASPAPTVQILPASPNTTGVSPAAGSELESSKPEISKSLTEAQSQTTRTNTGIPSPNSGVLDATKDSSLPPGPSTPIFEAQHEPAGQGSDAPSSDLEPQGAPSSQALKPSQTKADSSDEDEDLVISLDAKALRQKNEPDWISSLIAKLERGGQLELNSPERDTLEAYLDIPMNAGLEALDKLDIFKTIQLLQANIDHYLLNTQKFFEDNQKNLDNYPSMKAQFDKLLPFPAKIQVALNKSLDNITMDQILGIHLKDVTAGLTGAEIEGLCAILEAPPGYEPIETVRAGRLRLLSSQDPKATLIELLQEVEDKLALDHPDDETRAMLRDIAAEVLNFKNKLSGIEETLPLKAQGPDDARDPLTLSPMGQPQALDVFQAKPQVLKELYRILKLDEPEKQTLHTVFAAFEKDFQFFQNSKHLSGDILRVAKFLLNENTRIEAQLDDPTASPEDWLQTVEFSNKLSALSDKFQNAAKIIQKSIDDKKAKKAPKTPAVTQYTSEQFEEVLKRVNSEAILPFLAEADISVVARLINTSKDKNQNLVISEREQSIFFETLNAPKDAALFVSNEQKVLRIINLLKQVLDRQAATVDEKSTRLLILSLEAWRQNVADVPNNVAKPFGLMDEKKAQFQIYFSSSMKRSLQAKNSKNKSGFSLKDLDPNSRHALLSDVFTVKSVHQFYKDKFEHTANVIKLNGGHPDQNTIRLIDRGVDINVSEHQGINISQSVTQAENYSTNNLYETFKEQLTRLPQDIAFQFDIAGFAYEDARDLIKNLVDDQVYNIVPNLTPELEKEFSHQDPKLLAEFKELKVKASQLANFKLDRHEPEPNKGQRLE